MTPENKIFNKSGSQPGIHTTISINTPLNTIFRTVNPSSQVYFKEPESKNYNNQAIKNHQLEYQNLQINAPQNTSSQQNDILLKQKSNSGSQYIQQPKPQGYSHETFRNISSKYKHLDMTDKAYSMRPSPLIQRYENHSRSNSALAHNLDLNLNLK